MIEDKNAFQSIGRFSLEVLTREGIERQLIWNKKVDPSCFVSTINELSKFNNSIQSGNELITERMRN